MAMSWMQTPRIGRFRVRCGTPCGGAAEARHARLDRLVERRGRAPDLLSGLLGREPSRETKSSSRAARE
jgi:hypothetical protein